MNLYKYLPEAICLAIYITLSILLIDAIEQRQKLQSNIDAITSLEVIVPQQTTEILSTNFDSNLHYDLYAQLQLEIEKLMQALPHNSLSLNTLTRYNQVAANYMQLVTMLKTSRRLIAFNSQSNDQSQLMINNELLKFSLNPTAKQRGHFDRVITQSFNNSDRVFDSSWHTIQQHIAFILDNALVANNLKESLKNTNINQTLKQELDVYFKQHNQTQQLITSYIFIIILSFVFIFITVLKRQQYNLLLQTKLHKEAANVKTKFLANMSHEIRTPLTGIIGLTDLCKETKLDQLQKDYIDKLSFSATSLLRIINDILDFSKIEAGKLELEHVHYSHDELMENLAAMFTTSAQKKGLEIIYNIDPKLTFTTINGDPVRVVQILLNLVSNAIKFTSNGHVVISANIINKKAANINENTAKNDDFSHQEKPTKFIEYKIKDTGIGLSNKQIKKLFDRFVQADDSTTRKYGGTGLGLSICRSLAHLMEGDVRVESVLGEGSTFIVTLPLNAVEGIDKTIKADELANKALLFLDNSPETQHAFRRMVESFNIDLTVCQSQEEGITMSNDKRFDYIFLNWELISEHSGDYIQRLNTAQCTSRDITICSKDNLAELKSEHKTLQKHPILVKPFTMTQLVKHLKSTKEIAPEVYLPTAKVTTQKERFKDKILLVEDNRINQTIAMTILKKLGLDVDLAENGLEALNKVKNQQYDLILMDIRMPVMDGIEATKQLRKDFNQQELIIIALTANVTKEEIDYYLNIGMNGHLCKPYDKNLIEQEINKHIELAVTQ